MSFAAGTQQRAESLDSNLRHGTSDNNNRSSVQSNSTSNGNRPRSTSGSKALLTLALMEAQTAVQLDNDSNITGALEAYQRAVTVLNRVMNTTSSSDEQGRLRTIHDSYLFRIQLLSTPPTPTPPTPTTPSHPSPEDLHQEDAQDIDSSLSPPVNRPPHSPHDNEGPDPITTPTGLTFHVNLPSPRRTKKLSPSPLQHSSESQVLESGSLNGSRQRSDSASALTGGGQHHVGTHTGGSAVARPFTGDLVSAAEQLQLHAHQRIVPKISRDRMDVPLHLAPTIPLPPIPNSAAPAKGNLQGPLSPPLPVPGPPTNNPPVPNLSANQTFLASLAVNTNVPRSQSPTSPPPRANLPPILSNLSSTIPSAARRISPSMPSYLNSSLPLPPLPKPSTSSSAQASLISPGSSPEQQQKGVEQHHEEDQSKKEAIDPEGFYSDAVLMPDEWLPTLWSKEVTVSDSMFDQAHSQATSASEGTDSHSKDASLKGIYTHDVMANERRVYEKDKDGNYVQQDTPTSTPVPITLASRTSYQHRHQRSYSHSSLSRGDITESHPHQPLRSPLSSQLSTSQSVSSISNQYKLNSGSNRTSVKEGVANASGPSSHGRTAGSHNNSPVGARQSQQQQRLGILRHHSSLSKLSGHSTAVSTNSSNFSSADKSWSPSLGHGSNGGTFGLPAGLVSRGTTLFEVMADDPFGGMTFPLPPAPTLEPPPADQYFRAFWLMRRLEQTMTQGGFLTRRLFVPRTIWYQSMVRLPAAESKTSACQTLHSLLNKMSLQAQRGILTLMVEPGGGVDGDQDRTMILRELEALEAATVQIQNKLSKKFSFIHRPGKHPGHPPASTGFSAIPGSGTLSISTQHHHPGHSSYQDENPLSPDGHDDYESSTTTTPVTSPIRKSVVGAGLAGGGAGGVDTASLKNQWKNFSKSVQKSMGNDKVEDSSAYTDSVVSLFQSSYMLEDMLKHYNALSPFQTHIQIVNRLRRLSEFLYFVVCAFVVRDLSELMSRYLKRVGTWVHE